MTIIGSHNCVPGERLGSCEEYDAGRGTYERGGFIYSSRIGKINYTQVKGAKSLIEIIRENEPPVPSIGAVVTCKVIQVTQKYARCTIHAFDGRATSCPLKGMIRREDVRQTEKDRVELSKCFRPSDIVLATIISLGDQSNYLLSTAGDALGVILATNKYGYRLEPISWNEMRCPKTGVKEARKTAKIQEQLIEKA